MGACWADVEALLVESAEHDLARAGEAAPALAAFTGEEPQFVSRLRPFARGRMHEPLAEVLALGVLVGVDRLALSVTGRAWSLHDPIAPVAGGVDLRERVHVVQRCDGAAGRPRSGTVLRTFTVRDGTVSWGERHELGDGEGWFVEALERAVAGEADLPAPPGEIRRQAERVDRLGHGLRVSAGLALRMVRAGGLGVVR